MLKYYQTASIYLKAAANQWTTSVITSSMLSLGITTPPSGNTFWFVNWKVLLNSGVC